MSTRRVRKPGKFIRYIKSPIRVLARARDLYIQSLTGCAGHVSYGNSMGCPTPQIPSAPRSFSVKSPQSNYKTAEEELRDLIRLASTRSAGIELRRSKTSVPHGGGPAAVPRSHTVVFGRIDEDKPFEFAADDKVGLLGKVQRRASYAFSMKK
ncbi:hypothetical protein CDL12_10421 [Handroanthus impetiginosus]|uniref:Uncharacterized protein n=1 Tax=Handroanthus impetiginosus TaxID=429701 RepID=A0A2G9HHL9_9LAMI|nr:hypothetical protein CDL12_10421 [Handroanthus impetiginosus]